MSVQVKKRSGQCRNFRKESKVSAPFLAKTGRKKSLANIITANSSIGWCSLDKYKNISTFKLTVKTTQKYILYPLKSPEKDKIFANFLPQVPRRPKV